MNVSRTHVLVDGQIAWTAGELVLVGAVALVPAAFDPESEEPTCIVSSGVTVPVLACPAGPDPDPDPEDRELVGAVATGLDRVAETESLGAVVCSLLDGTGEAKELAGAVVPGPGFDGGAETAGPAGVVSPGPVGAAGAGVGPGVPSDWALTRAGRNSTLAAKAKENFMVGAKAYCSFFFQSERAATRTGRREFCVARSDSRAEQASQTSAHGRQFIYPTMV